MISLLANQECRPKEGGQCIFPFNFNGKTCPGPKCCNLDNDSTGSWCATRVDENGTLEGAYYGYCAGTPCDPGNEITPMTSYINSQFWVRIRPPIIVFKFRQICFLVQYIWDIYYGFAKSFPSIGNIRQLRQCFEEKMSTPPNFSKGLTRFRANTANYYYPSYINSQCTEFQGRRFPFIIVFKFKQLICWCNIYVAGAIMLKNSSTTYIMIF